MHLVDSVVDREAGGLLAWRKFPEGLHELSDQMLRRDQQIRMVKDPIPVSVRGDIRVFVRVRPQVVDFRHSQRNQRLGPDLKRALGALFQEDYLLVVVAEAGKIAVIRKVEEALARILLIFAGHHGEQIVAVEVYFESFVPGFMAL